MIFYSENHAGLPRFLSGGPEMERTTTVISQADIDRQLDFCRQARSLPRLSLDSLASIGVLLMTLTFTLRILVF